MFPDFKTIKYFNDLGIEQNLDWYCENKFITQDQYKELTNKEYNEATANEN